MTIALISYTGDTCSRVNLSLRASVQSSVRSIVWSTVVGGALSGSSRPVVASYFHVIPFLVTSVSRFGGSLLKSTLALSGAILCIPLIIPASVPLVVSLG